MDIFSSCLGTELTWQTSSHLPSNWLLWYVKPHKPQERRVSLLQTGNRQTTSSMSQILHIDIAYTFDLILTHLYLKWKNWIWTGITISLIYPAILCINFFHFSSSYTVGTFPLDKILTMSHYWNYNVDQFVKASTAVHGTFIYLTAGNNY